MGVSCDSSAPLTPDLAAAEKLVRKRVPPERREKLVVKTRGT
jgi:hypothetical protein